MGQVIRDQLKANPANAPILVPALAAIDQLEAGKHVDVAGLHPALQQLFAPAVQDFLIDSFRIDPAKPLIWGANGLAVRRTWAVEVWRRDGYVADVDAFHAMVQAGHSTVAYEPGPFVFHHQVATMGDLRRKWQRNAMHHLVSQSSTRELDWVLVRGFRRRLILWFVYSVVPVFSTADALRRARRDRSVYWLYHPAATFLQAVTYAQTLASAEGRGLLRRALLRRR